MAATMRLHLIVGTLAALATLASARAQDVRIAAPAPTQAEAPLSPEESALLARALRDAGLTDSAPRKPLRRPAFGKRPALAVNRTEQPDGSSKVAVKQPLAPAPGGADLTAAVGADVALAAPPVTTFEPGRPLPGQASNDAGSGAAWASVGMQNLASVDARVDPTADQGRLAGTLQHAMPVGRDLSVTLRDSYSVTQPLSAAVPDPAAPSPATTPAQTFGNERSVKLDVKPTGTRFGAALTTSSADSVTHRTLSAEQKLYGPLHVTTAVTDPGQPTENKSITAGFKLNW
jgi:hypothetical protein